MFSAVKVSERARALLVSPAKRICQNKQITGKIPIRDTKECKQQAIECDLKKVKSRFMWLK